MARKKSGNLPPRSTNKTAAKPAAEDPAKPAAEDLRAPLPEGRDESSGHEPRAGPAVVGIGASAGGLQAFKQFLGVMPSDSGMAFILTPHLAPQHESMLAGLLAQHTEMPVVEARDGMAVEADHVYIIPPNKYLSICDGVLRLSGPVERHDLTTPIDAFWESLSVEQRERAICVVLSGSAPYGIKGLKAIKAAGGLVVVQEPATAEYDRMPRAAIATDLADFILPIEQMPATLANYSRHIHTATPGNSKSSEKYDDELERILALLRTHTKRDYRCYRKSMVARRVERRMCLTHATDIPTYLEFLRKYPDEIGRLAKDLSVGVTSFFREPEAFRVLAARAIVDLVARKEPDETIRIWVPGCSTGEEAYSIAILFLEQLAKERKACSLKVFASDIDEQALAFARQGVYHDNLQADIGTERMTRFFIRLDEHTWQIGKHLREAVVFAAQDLLADAPFSKLDLISCRNLLIYLDPEVQPRVIALFHFALNEGGTLMLGPSETIARQTEMFEPLDKKWRIYRRLTTARRERVDFPIVRSMERRPATARWTGPPPRPGGLMELAHRALLAEYAPAAVVIDQQNQVLIFQGPTALYLDQPAGEATHDLLLLARPGLRSKLRTAILKAAKVEQPIVVGGARVRRDSQWCAVRVGVMPLAAPQWADGLLLVTFEDEHSPPAADGPETIADEALLRPLEEELSTAREELQFAQEEMTTSHEELRLVNEEAMSMNEELQSTNEELETSKEELQSLNEELSTANSQLQEKVEELESANNDVANLLASAELATICLDAELRIRWFAPASTRLLNLIAGDVGRPISDIAETLTGGKLLDDAARVLRELAPVERELAAPDGRWYLRRILPYRASGNGVDGVVITFADVTLLKRDTEHSRLLATVLLDSNDAVLVLDLQGRVTAWNRGAERMYGYSEAEALRMNVQQLVPESKRVEVAERLANLARGEAVASVESRRLTKDGRVLEVWLTFTVIRDSAKKPLLIAATERDVTEWNHLRRQLEERGRQLEAALHGSLQRTSTIVDTVHEGIVIIDERGMVETFNRSAERIFGYAADEIVGRNVRMLLPPLFQGGFDRFLARFADTPDQLTQGRQREIPALRKDGSRFALEISLSEMLDGKERHYVAVLRDVSDRKTLEKEVLEIAAREQRRIGQDLHDGAGQALTGLGLLARGLVETLGKKSTYDAELATKIAEGIKTTVQEIRGVVRGLVPVEVRDGLMAALNQLAIQTSGLPRVSCTFECIRPVDVTDNFLATHIYRIAQEAVANAVKHGQSRQIEISLTDDDAELRLEVVDDGLGIKQGADESQGMGLRLMRYRAGLIGGFCAIGPADAGGTRVVCAVSKS